MNNINADYIAGDTIGTKTPVSGLLCLALIPVLGVFLAVPFMVPPGFVYALMAFFGAFILIVTRNPALLLLLAFFWGYQVAVSFICTENGHIVAETNSPIMMQMSMAMLCGGVFLSDSRNRNIATYVSMFILAVALISLVSEKLGYDLMRHIPSRYSDSALFQEGTVVYETGETRLRGVYPEASAIGAVCGTYLGLALILLFSLPPTRHFVRQKILWASSAAVALIAMGMTLTKSGLFIAAASLAMAMAVYGIVRKSGKALRYAPMALIVVAILAASVVFGPEQYKDYVVSEFETARALLQGNGPEGLAGKGIFARTEGMVIAVKSLTRQPFGNALANVNKVASKAGVNTTTELNRDFAQGIYGLKCAFANMLFQGGLISLVFMASFLYFLFLYKRGDGSAMYLARYYSIFATIALWFTIENRYYYYCLPILVSSVIKYYEYCQDSVGSQTEVEL